MSPLLFPEQSSSSCTFFGFPASSAYLIPFQKWLYDFEIHIFTPRTTEGLIHNYYKRWKHLLMLKKATQCIKSQGCKLLNRMMMCKFLFCLTIIFFHLVLDFRRQNKYNLPWSSNLKSLHPPSLNALCGLLEHQYMFSPFVIVMPSIVLSVKRWISKSYSQCWKGFKYAEDAGKAKNVQELEDFSEEQQAVELLRTNKGLMNNYHKI